ncbi:MAG TPA: hypothetical protein VFP46_02515, partial [Candidatus Paceibacterota bacterium]|nr:hypothetical protein [Candidatus Paceibacterota bacterium]
MEPTLEESLKQVLGTLPPVLRKYVLEERYTPVARELMGRYHLRVDQGGVLEREMLLLLIGVDTPDEFVASLASDAGLDEATIDGITRDVNE